MRAHGFRVCFTPLPGCFSPFPHGTRPLSVTGWYLALDGGPPCFPPGSSCPAVLRAAAGRPRAFAYGALTLSRAPSHALPLARGFLTPPGGCAPRPRRPQPRRRSARTLCRSRRFGPLRFRSPLLPQSLLDFLSSGYLDVSVPPVASPFGVAGPRLLGSPIRAPRDLRLSAAPPGLSRLPAPFVGPPCQGIRRAPLTPPSRGARGQSP